MTEKLRPSQRELALPIGFFFCVILVWEASVRVLAIPAYLLPAPSVIAHTVGTNAGSLSVHMLVTMVEAVAGFCVANVLGFLVAVVFAHSRPVEKAIYPYAIALKTTPIVAMAPLLVLWLGTGLLSKVAAAAVICFFPMLVNATRGLRRIDEEALDLFRSLAATGTQIFFKLRLPTSLPYVFSALKISTSLAVVGAVVGEFVGAQRGLGYLILVSSYHLETDVMFAAVIAAALGGVIFFGVISVLEKLLVPWGEPVEE